MSPLGGIYDIYKLLSGRRKYTYNIEAILFFQMTVLVKWHW